MAQHHEPAHTRDGPSGSGNGTRRMFACGCWGLCGLRGGSDHLRGSVASQEGCERGEVTRRHTRSPPAPRADNGCLVGQSWNEALRTTTCGAPCTPPAGSCPPRATDMCAGKVNKSFCVPRASMGGRRSLPGRRVGGATVRGTPQLMGRRSICTPATSCLATAARTAAEDRRRHLRQTFLALLIGLSALHEDAASTPRLPTCSAGHWRRNPRARRRTWP